MQSEIRRTAAFPGLAALALVVGGNLLAPHLGSPNVAPANRATRVTTSTVEPRTGAPLELVPDRALVKVAVDAPGPMLDLLAAQPGLGALRQLPGELSQGLRELDAKLDEAEAALGRTPRSLLDDLAGAGGAFWFDLVGLQPTWGIALRASDPARGREALELLLATVADQAGYPDAFASPTAHRDGVDLWEIDDQFVVGWRDGTVLIGPTDGAVRAALGSDAARPRDRRRGNWSPAGPPGALRAQIDMERVKLLAELGDDDGLRDLIALADTPEGQLLFGPSLATVARAEVLDLWLAADAGGLELGLIGEGLDVVPPTATPAALAPTDADLLYAHLHRRPGVLVDGSLRLTDEANAELAKGLSQFELLMGGLDLRRDVLPAVGPTVHLVAREIPFHSGPRPEVRTPAIAAVVSLADGDALREPLIAAFQNAIVLSNVDRAQKGEGQPFVLRRVEVDERRALTAAHYRRPLDGEPVDMAYNVAPASAAVGDWLVMATHEDLLNDLLDELPTSAETGARAQPVADRPGPAAERLVIDGGSLVPLLESQREALSLSIGLRRGVSEGRADEILDATLVLLASQARLTVELEPTEEGLALVARLDGGVRTR